MKNFWENIFSTEKYIWGLAPSDSALFAKDYFANHGIKKILVPGAGYGRNAAVFYQNGFDVTGIEISPSAILQAKINGNNFQIHQGSVINMPFDQEMYQGIFCYSLLHLLNKHERKTFLEKCFQQLMPGGQMIFTVVSTKASMYASGPKLSKNRYKLNNGVNVYFYDIEAVKKEFKNFGLIDCREIDEPIKHMENELPLKCLLITCKKERTPDFSQRPI